MSTTPTWITFLAPTAFAAGVLLSTVAPSAYGGSAPAALEAPAPVEQQALVPSGPDPRELLATAPVPPPAREEPTTTSRAQTTTRAPELAPPAECGGGPRELGSCLAARLGVPDVRFVVTRRYGHWGAADVQHRVVYLSPRVPAHRTRDVLLHELAHIAVHDAVGRGVDGGRRYLNQVFGGSGWRGADLASDCLARTWGATWTYYTSCSSSAEQARFASVYDTLG